MQAKAKNRGWRIVRRLFRWFRIAVLLATLGLLIFAIWLNRVGVPDFLRDRLVIALRERGMDVQFTRMRLLWFRGIVADNIRFGQSGVPRGPQASATEAEVHLRVKPLLRRELDVEGVALRGGRVKIPIWGTNDQPRELIIEKLGGELHFLPNDCWDLSGLRAETFGVTLLLGGTVTNASAIRHWKFGRDRPKPKTPQAFWHDLVYRFEQTKFESPTEIVGTVSGDALEMQTFRVNLDLTSPEIDSPWGKGRNLKLSAQIAPEPGKLIHAEIKLQAQDPETRWGRASSVQLEARLTPSLTQWTPTNAHLDLQLKRAQTPWGNAASVTIKADFRPNPAEAAASLADYSVRGQQVQTPWARFAQAELTASGVVSSSNAWPRTAKTTLKFAGGEIAAGRAAAGNIEASLALPPLEALQFANTNVTWWTRLDLIEGDASTKLTDVHSPRLDLKTISLKSSWHNRLLLVTGLDAAVYDGTLHGSAKLDSAARLLSAEVRSDFDPQKAAQLLTTNGQRWLAQYGWEQPPKISGTVLMRLPAWTNQAGWKIVDWAGEVLPTLALAGNIQVGPSTFRDVPVATGQTDFVFSNRTWRLPNILVTRPEGRAHIALVSDDLTRRFQFVIDSTVDPRILRPLLTPVTQKVIDDFTITSPPLIHAEIAGQWNVPEQTSVRATCLASNLGYRQQVVLGCRSLITLTNQVLSFIEPEVSRTEGTARAESVVLDYPRLKLFINHASGVLDPAAVTKAIGDKVAKTMEPYHFVHLSHGTAHGFVDLEDELRSDLRFTAAGGPFEWRAFRFQQITGEVHWAGTLLTLSNVLGSLHGGRMEASAAFDFKAREGADFAFRTQVRNIDLQSLVADLGNATNRLEGTLGGLLVITNANTENPLSWCGYGNMTLEDGLIWDVPVFGLFSPLLNAINPRAGNSRAKDAVATFLIADSVISTKDLRIHASSGMRLNYEGTVDFDTRINGRMEAELFRDAPGVGQVVAKVFWPVTKIFEYKVTGTFSKPKSEPLFIPKIFMMPFHPLRTMRELLEGNKEETLPPAPLFPPKQAE